jgi:beta-glucosidase-like glycosyl hydrolase/CubicO group peptidase (beta-lactamase class C family)
MFRFAYTLAGLMLWASCHRAQEVLEIPQGPTPPPFLTADSAWVDSVLATLTMEERVAQLLMVPIYAKPDTVGWGEAERWTRDLGLGGVICMQGGPELQRIRLQRLQSRAKVPLMVASDAEWGLGMRLDSTRSFPRAMTLGATRNPELVRMFGQVVGQSLRATGVHVNFAPVVDVNSNPINPVIGSRSFGEDVEWVGRLGQAYADGMQDVHVLATAKHFPGHGDSDSDSHATLPTIGHTRERLDSVELAPFRHVFEHGMGAVMVAHLDVPGLDSTLGQPSTLSPAIVDTLLRQEMGFEGLVFTDAMSMKGFADFVGDRPRIRDALLAGNDVLLFPGDPKLAIDEAMRALAEGTLDSASVTDKCRRVLLAKAWCRADEPLPRFGEACEPVHADIVHREVLAQSLTALPCLDSPAVAPLCASSGKLVLWDVANHSTSCAPLEAQLRSHLGSGWTVERHVLGKDANGLGREAVRTSLDGADHLVVTLSEMSHRPSRQFGLQPEGVRAVVRAMETWGVPAARVTVVWMGNPYALSDLTGFADRASSLLVAYQDDAATCQAVADALVGVAKVGGRLPVSPVEAPWREGDGLSWAGHQRLGRPVGERLGFWTTPLARVDSVLGIALDRGAMPGGRVVVAHRGQIVLDKCVGTLDGVRPVTPSSVYDVASITKVAATGSLLMRRAADGLLELDWPMDRLLPELQDHPLGTRTVREVLTHQAGLEPWIPFYLSALKDSSGVFGTHPTDGCSVEITPSMYLEDAYADTVWNAILNAELRPAGTYRYSDLGFYLWARVLANAGTDLETWVDEKLARPMGWSSMGFNPLSRGVALDDIAPTELDNAFRQCVVHGRVHDPGAALQGGVGCHAGLFSNAYDLAELGEAWLRGGTLRGVELAPASVLSAWTRRGFPKGDNRRGVVFDKPALDPDSGPTCDLASWESFGHTGFTGTLLWVDPTYELVYVFLSNRTFPNASNNTLLKLDTRTEIQRVVLEHLGAPSRFSRQVSRP